MTFCSLFFCTPVHRPAQACHDTSWLFVLAPPRKGAFASLAHAGLVMFPSCLPGMLVRRSVVAPGSMGSDPQGRLYSVRSLCARSWIHGMQGPLKTARPRLQQFPCAGRLRRECRVQACGDGYRRTTDRKQRGRRGSAAGQGATVSSFRSGSLHANAAER